MKAFMVMVIVLCLMVGGVVHAEEENGRTTFLNFDSGWDNLGIIDPITGQGYTDDNLNNYLNHDHGFEYWKTANPIGGYVKGIFYQFQDEAWGKPTLEGEYRYDGANGIHEFWIGCTLDFDAMRRKLLGW